MTVTAAVVQTGSILFDTPRTLARVEEWCARAQAAGATVAVFPEALLGGYPKGASFGATLGARTPAGREWFRRYHEAAVAIPGPETARLAELAHAHQLTLVMGVVERAGGTLYCSSLLFQPGAAAPYVHRKLMPTAVERIVWGMGDASTMDVVATPAGRAGMAICWENYMPEYRMHLYRQGVELWCAPTVDDRAMWPVTMRHIAYEGRCFVLSACQYLTRADCPPDFESSVADEVLIRGGSVMVSPFGDILSGPAQGETLLTATLDLDEIARGKFDLDVAGHYRRPDVFGDR